MGIYKAVAFNTTTNFIDVTTSLDPGLIYPTFTAPVSAGGNTYNITSAQNAVDGTTIYLGTFPASNQTGFQAVVAGFNGSSPDPNNGTFTIVSNTTSQLILNNPNGSAETHAATVQIAEIGPNSLVSVANVSGTIEVSLAYAASSGSPVAESPAVGYVLTSAVAGNDIQVYASGSFIQPGFTVSQVGATVYLSDATPGLATTTAPSGPSLIQPVGTILFVDASGNATISFFTTSSAGGGGSSAFSSLTGGTNTSAAMVIGSGASLGISGSGTNAATSVGGVTVSGAAASGKVLTASSSSAAGWQTPTTGSGTVNSGTANQLAIYAGTGTAVSGDSLLTDNGTTLAYTGTGGISMPALTVSGATSFGAGTIAVAALAAAAKEWAASAFAAGVGTSSQILFRIRLAQAVQFPSGAANSYGTSTVLATGSTVYTASKNGTGFATFTFTGASLEATVAIGSTTTFASGDLLEIDGPGSADATLANVGITIAGVKQ